MQQTSNKRPTRLSNSATAMAVLTIAFTLALTACSKNENRQYPTPLATNLQTTEAAPLEAGLKLESIKAKNGLSATLSLSTTSSKRITARIQLKKAAILDRAFLYGADLQYSSVQEDDDELIVQSMATGHLPAFFRLMDDRLQLLADQKLKFESDVNHPERLIHEFPVVAEDAETVTIEIRKASPILTTVLVDEKEPNARTAWIRSAEFVENGQFLMFESSIETHDGKVAEFMESIFPRDTVISPEADAIFNDKELNESAERYRYLSDGTIWLDIKDKGRVQTKVADRYSLKDGQTIDWYVTPNIPEEYIGFVKSGVEGWNRYSQKMWGRDFIRFKGRLPEGAKIGDPRFNVINWDSVAEAGAAYESQATDPYTGIQTHSLIYLPKAWVNIGQDYWKLGSASEDSSPESRVQKAIAANGKLLGRKLPVHCIREAMMEISLKARTSPEEFAHELLKGVIFHEIGHALGLGHNFKGSLVMDPEDEKSSFSSSIMDYNQYQIEKSAFTDLASSDGPLLEYDRQVISMLYNGGKDVSATDPEVPACTDEESDDSKDGVDPLCIRYDAGKDPTVTLEKALDLVKDPKAKARNQKSLPAALEELTSELASGVADASKITTKEEAVKAGKTLAKAAVGTVGFYYTKGAQSLSNTARVNIRSLRKWQDDILPEGYEEIAMRQRAIKGIRYIAQTETFETATREALASYKSSVQEYLSSSPYIQGLSPDKRADEVKLIMKDMAKFPESLEFSILSKLREAVFGSLSAMAGSPFYFIETNQTSMDFEREIATVLARATTGQLASGKSRAISERSAAAKALKSFAHSAVGASFVQESALALQAEAKNAKDLASRSDAVAVYKILTKEESK